jgi:phosphotransferase system HPr (HPr) family protein
MSQFLSTATVVVSNPQGLHMRPANLLVTAAGKFASNVTIVREGQAVDCKSILGILTLGAVQGSQLDVRAEGPDADSAIETIVDLFQRGFDEPTE